MNKLLLAAAAAITLAGPANANPTIARATRHIESGNTSIRTATTYKAAGDKSATCSHLADASLSYASAYVLLPIPQIASLVDQAAAAIRSTGC